MLNPFEEFVEDDEAILFCGWVFCVWVLCLCLCLNQALLKRCSYSSQQPGSDTMKSFQVACDGAVMSSLYANIVTEQNKQQSNIAAIWCIFYWMRWTLYIYSSKLERESLKTYTTNLQNYKQTKL